MAISLIRNYSRCKTKPANYSGHQSMNLIQLTNTVSTPGYSSGHLVRSKNARHFYPKSLELGSYKYKIHELVRISL